MEELCSHTRVPLAEESTGQAWDNRYEMVYYGSQHSRELTSTEVRLDQTEYVNKIQNNYIEELARPEEQ